MLFSVLPLTVVLPSIRPSEHSTTLLLVVQVATDIPAPILPSEGALTAHPVVPPLTTEDSAIIPSVRSVAVNLIVFELALIGRSFWPRELSSTVLLSSLVLAFELGAISPLLHGVAFLLVVLPLTHVAASVRMVVD